MIKKPKMHLDGLSWEDIKEYSVKDILAFWQHGTYHILAKSFTPVEKCCRCGKRAWYVCVDVRSDKFMHNTMEIAFFCKECWQEEKNV